MTAKLTIFSKLLAPIINVPILYICSIYLEGDALKNFSTLLFSSLLIQTLTAGASLRFFKIIRLGGWKYSKTRVAATVFYKRQVIIGAVAYVVLRHFFIEGDVSLYEFLMEMLLFSFATPSVFYQRIYYSRISFDLFKSYILSGVLALIFAIYLAMELHMPSAVLVYSSLQVFLLHMKLKERVDFKSIYRKSFFFSKNIGPFYALEFVSALYAYADQFSLTTVVSPELMGGVSFVFRMVAYLVASLSIFSFVIHYNLSGQRTVQLPMKILKRAFFLSVIGSLSVFVIALGLRYTTIEVGGLDNFSFWGSVYLWTFVQVFAAYTYSIVISQSKVSNVIRKLSIIMLISLPFLVFSALLGHIVLVLMIKSAVLLICIFIHIRFILKCQNNQS